MPGNRDPYDVAEAVLALSGDEEPGADVLDEPLQAKAQRRAEQGGGRDQPGQRHAEALHDQDAGDDIDHGQEGPGEDLRGDVPVLGRFGAHQLITIAVARVDVRHDPVPGPFGQPGQQDRAQHEQNDFQQGASGPQVQVIQRSDCSWHGSLQSVAARRAGSGGHSVRINNACKLGARFAGSRRRAATAGSGSGQWQRAATAVSGGGQWRRAALAVSGAGRVAAGRAPGALVEVVVAADEPFQLGSLARADPVRGVAGPGSAPRRPR